MRRRLVSGADILRFLIPASETDISPKDWLAALEGAGATALAKTMAAALHDDSSKMSIPPGTPLEADLLLDDLARVEQELGQANLLPFDVNCPTPSDWDEAAENAVTLMAATVRLTRERRSTAPQREREAILEPRTGTKEKAPIDSFQPIKVASKGADMAGAVDPIIVEALTTMPTLRSEHLRSSPFKSLTSSSTEERDAALPGELVHFLSSYGQAASAYLVSNGMSLAELRGPGVPTALAGVRAHLLRKATSLVDEHFGAERASAMRSEAERLSLSMLTASGGSDTTTTALEETLVKLLGGSRPHPTAEIDDEGGSVSAGTLGAITGPEGQWSVRSAYPRWARGVAKAMGPVLLAARVVYSSDTVSYPISAVLGEDGDFGVAAALNRIPHNLPVESVRSICRYFPSELARAALHHRREPGAPLPDVRLIVETMAKDVFSKRMLDHKFAEKVAKENAALTERLAKVEAKLSTSGQRGEQSSSSSNKATAGGEKTSAKYNSKKRPHSEKSSEAAAGSEASQRGKSGNTQTSDNTSTTAGTTPESSAATKSSPSTGTGIETMMGAVKALQTLVRTRLSLPIYHDNGEKEPCAWHALAGRCKNQASCKSCKGKMEMPSDLIEEVKSKCKPGVFNSSKKQADKSA